MFCVKIEDFAQKIDLTQKFQESADVTVETTLAEGKDVSDEAS